MKKIFIVIRLILNNPLRILALLLIKSLPNLVIKKKIFYSGQVSKKLFLISFDCDTQKDIFCLEELLIKLHRIKIKAVLAIPAELLVKNLELITDLKNKYSIEFLNHGYYIHTEFHKQENSYRSIFSYEKKDIEFIKEDIILAHNFFRDKLNINLKGFRAPHFGEISFKKKRKIFKFLKEIGYEFSSSSIYDLAFIKGPLFKSDGITEITVTGCVDNQSSMLDSWSFLKPKSNEVILLESYFDEINKLKHLMKKEDFNYINIYADPSHIINSNKFFSSLEEMVKYNILKFEEIKI